MTVKNSACRKATCASAHEGRWTVHVSDNPVWCGNPRIRKRFVSIVPVFAKLLFLLIKPYVQAGIAFFKSFNVEVVYQDFGQDCSEQLVWFCKDNTILLRSSLPTGKIR